MSAKHEVTTRGVVIGRASAGEGSVRVFLYTEALGLIAALAKSAREERSKLRPHLQVGTIGTYTLVCGAHDWRVIGAIGTRNAHFASSTLDQCAVARVISLVRQLVKGEGVNEALFETLYEFLKNPNPAAEHATVARILLSLGYLTPAALDGDERSLVAAINRGLASSGLV